ncbi:MAG: cation ABC transporter substrate-binding protein [Deltaproteobacteria bacterium HGW-Deltaproteobacteria-20]|nr:MAG: cation ABC transporter substrate-binding protein [Deltaproteobacteria bacterium HGW-Deltaproteobacteria-20]
MPQSSGGVFMKRVLFSALAVLLLLASVAAAEPVSVFVSILPQKYFVEQIGGERVDVSAMVEKGRDPHVFEPLPAQMEGLSKAKAYFAVGLPFEESLLPRAASLNPGLKIYHIDEGIDKITGGHEHHDEHKDEKHEHHDPHREGADPHVWNSPREAILMAGKIVEGLTAIDPDGREEYARRHADFVERLKTLDAEFAGMFRGRQGATFLVFHPAWAYFARSYGLVEVAIETEGKEPKAADLANIISEAKERGVKAIFISPQFSKRSAEIVAQAIGASVTTADPLAAEWEENLRAVAKAIAEAAK